MLRETCLEGTGDFDLALLLAELKMLAEALKVRGCTDEQKSPPMLLEVVAETKLTPRRHRTSTLLTIELAERSTD